MKGYFSTWAAIISGVPQGSILGPLLYLLFAEDMKNHIEAGLRNFADDTLLSGIGLTERQCAAEPSLGSQCSWAKRWKITLNPTKTKCQMVCPLWHYPLVVTIPIHKGRTI